VPVRVDDDKVEEYKVQHLNVYTQAGLQWPPLFTKAFMDKTNCLSPHEQEVLFYDEAVNGGASTLDGLHVRDMHMSHDWGNIRVGFTPTIASSSNLWVRGTYVRDGSRITVDRKLCGAELLWLQGFSPRLWRDRVSPGDFSQKELLDLAGNAFCIGHVVPILVGIIACVPWKDAIGHSAAEFGKAPAQAQSDEDLDMDEDMEEEIEEAEGSESSEAVESS
jgi:hypothetical protein